MRTLRRLRRKLVKLLSPPGYRWPHEQYQAAHEYLSQQPIAKRKTRFSRRAKRPTVLDRPECRQTGPQRPQRPASGPRTPRKPRTWATIASGALTALLLLPVAAYPAIQWLGTGPFIGTGGLPATVTSSTDWLWSFDLAAGSTPTQARIVSFERSFVVTDNSGLGLDYSHDFTVTSPGSPATGRAYWVVDGNETVFAAWPTAGNQFGTYNHSTGPLANGQHTLTWVVRFPRGSGWTQSSTPFSLSLSQQ